MADVSIFEQLRPGYCARWHANPEMVGTETVAAHSARVARVILHFWPQASAALLAAAISHDDGEMGLGDVAGWAKRQNPALAEMMNAIEAENRRALGLPDHDLLPFEERLLHLADKFAGLLHVKQVRPDLIARGRFQPDLIDLEQQMHEAALLFPGPFLAMAAELDAEFPWPPVVSQSGLVLDV